jgi:serpin B
MQIAPCIRKMVPFGAVLATAAQSLLLASEVPVSASCSKATNAFGIDLYRALAAKSGNIVISPYGISESLALLAGGASGTTKEQLLHALHWDESADQLAAAYGAEDSRINQAAKFGLILSVANGFWYQKGYPLNSAFLRIAKDDFHAQANAVDFVANGPEVEAGINQWVARETAGKIPSLISSGSISATTRLLLANAVYFKGEWETPFKPDRTTEEPFFTAPADKVFVQMMTQDDDFKVASAPTCDLLELPYTGGGFSMVVLLPKEQGGLAALDASLNETDLFEWLATLDFSKAEHVDLSLPRFRMSYSTELTASLEQLGVAAAFDRTRADFSGINGRHDLYASTVLHKAYIDVNETGTEAAAATEIQMVALGVQRSREFNVNHPFIFLIRDNATGSVLFLGRVVNPSTP